MDRIKQIHTFCSYYQVSRETIDSLKIYEKLLIEANEGLNLIGKSTINDIWTRHFLDSYQVIDFVDKNDDIIIDLGSGAGFPGIIIGLAASEKKIPIKIHLSEKSIKKSNFLKRIVRVLNINVEVINADVIKEDYKFSEDVFVARAFKPLASILELIHKKAKNWKKIIIFQGKTGGRELLLASKRWDMKYKQRRSLTNTDSLILEIKELKKKNE